MRTARGADPMAKRSPKKYLTCEPPIRIFADTLAFGWPCETTEAFESFIDWSLHSEDEGYRVPDLDPGTTPAEVTLRCLEEGAREILRDEGYPTDLSHAQRIEEEQFGEDESLLSVRVSSAADVLAVADIVRDRIIKNDAPGAALYMVRVAASAVRMKLYEPALHGITRSRTQSEVGTRRGAQRKAAVAERDAKLRDLAEEIRAKHPEYSEHAVALLLGQRKDKPEGTPSTDRIRKIIKPA